MTQLTRPEAVGNDHAVASTHHMATAIGAEVLARGGNAADAACAVAFALNVVEPHLKGPAGEVPIIVKTHAGVRVLDGQGVAPALATIAHYRSEGLDQIPGTGLLAATVPSAFATLTTLLEQLGTWELSEVLAPAIALAERGYPMLPSASRTIAAMAAHFASDWPTSAETWLTDGRAPKPHERWRNPQLAATWRRLIDEGAGESTREARIARSRDAFMSGFVAEEIEKFVQTPVMDASGSPHRGVLQASDLAVWSPTWEAPEQARYQGWTVSKTSFWGQGPVFLQQLQLLDALGLADIEYGSAQYLHVAIEASKLAFADREAWYGDPRFVHVPRELLSAEYAGERAALVGERASMELRAGSPGGRVPRIPTLPESPGGSTSTGSTSAGSGSAEWGAAGSGEPTVGSMASVPPAVDNSGDKGTTWDGTTRGDTCHLDVTDRWGMTVSATPSGGWLQSSPTIPALGFCLGSRAQMFRLDERSPSALAPGRRPRTTLSPSLAEHDDGTVMAFGTPGGDQQDQWSLHFFLSLVHGGLRMQAALEQPMWHQLHSPESFAPRLARPGVVLVEETFRAVAEQLRSRGHRVETVPAWSLGRMTAVSSGAPDGFLRAAANPRGEQGSAIAR